MANGIIFRKSQKLRYLLNANTYKAMKGYRLINKVSPKLAKNLSLAHNKSWITRQVKNGVKIYDIGIDKSRLDRSIYYAMEQSVVNGYPNHLKLF